MMQLPETTYLCIVITPHGFSEAPSTLNPVSIGQKNIGQSIGVGRFRILGGWGGGARFRILGGPRGGGQIPSRHVTS